MRTSIVTALIFSSLVFSGIVRASEPKGNISKSENSYYNLAGLKVESWMIDISSWVSNSKASLTIREETLKVENWMLRPDYQSWGNLTSEGSVQLEKWMIDIQHSDWNNFQAEPEILFEDWMCDLSSWATS